ncbi:MAG: acetoacetate decarboxylase family protein [Pseudomonadota bacterium]
MKIQYAKAEAGISELSPRYDDHKFSDVDILFYLYETRPEAIAAMLPPPLEPMNPPIVTMNSWSLAGSNTLSPFTGSAIFIPCKYNKVQGAYCIHAAINAGWDILFGSEIIAASEKDAKTKHVREGSRISVHVERRGKEYITILGELYEPANIIELAKELNVFFFKYIPVHGGSCAESDPILMRTHFNVRYNSLEKGRGEIKYSVSDQDVLKELNCLKPVAFLHGNMDIRYKTELIATVPVKEFLPYAAGKPDNFELSIK